MRKTLILGLLALFIIIPISDALAYGTDYRYTGQQRDANSNLYYYGQRYYQPEVGRFTQPDPVSKYLINPQKLKQATGQDLQEFLENPQALIEYGYVQNNPIKYTDPDGEFGILAILGVAVAVGFTAWDFHDAYKTFNSTQATLKENIAERVASQAEDGFITFYRGTNNFSRNLTEGIKSQSVYFTDIFDIASKYAWGWNQLIDPGVASFKLSVEKFINYIDKGLIIADPKDANGFKVI